jgi:hypothetical protein
MKGDSTIRRDIRERAGVQGAIPLAAPEDHAIQETASTGAGARAEGIDDCRREEREMIERVLRDLVARIHQATYIEMAAEHIDPLLTVMSYLQENPEDGFEMIRAVYEEAGDAKVKGLLVFIASAARDWPGALDFFRAVMSDKAGDPAVRVACVYALGMANLRIAGGDDKVKGHYTTVLWAIGAMLRPADPRLVYVSMAGERPWPRGIPFGWQGTETCKAVLQILMDSFESEPCPRVRYVTVSNILTLEDEEALALFWLRAYEKETWTIPEGHFCEGVNVARNQIVRYLATRTVKSRQPVWLDALRGLFGRVSPWDHIGYYDAVIEAYDKLGWIDKELAEYSLLPFTSPGLGGGKFPANTSWVCTILKNADKFWSPEEISNLFLQVVRVTAANHKDDSYRDARNDVLVYCLSKAEGLSSETEICRILLFHPKDGIRSAAIKHIDWRQLETLRDDLLQLAQTEKEAWVLSVLEEVLQRMAPEELATLREKGLFKIPTTEEQLDEMLRTGQLTQEEWEYFRKSSTQDEEGNK